MVAGGWLEFQNEIKINEALELLIPRLREGIFRKAAEKPAGIEPHAGRRIADHRPRRQELASVSGTEIGIVRGETGLNFFVIQRSLQVS